MSQMGFSPKGPITKHMAEFSKNQSPVFMNNIGMQDLLFMKTNPRINRNYSGVTSNFLYVYLDPFKPVKNQKDFFYRLNGRTFKDFKSGLIQFGFEPFYIGKGVSSTGHRQSQHIGNFLKEAKFETITGDRTGRPNNVVNQLKFNRMQEIERKMSMEIPNLPYSVPTNWEEYKNNWVITIAEFQSREELEVAEKEIVTEIGTIKNGRGPLTNISFSRY